jgi:hypothetical protein
MNVMKEKQFEPEGSKSSSPAPGLASVNTHNPDEETSELQPGKERVKIDQVEKEIEPTETEREPRRDSPV